MNELDTDDSSYNAYISMLYKYRCENLKLRNLSDVYIMTDSELVKEIYIAEVIITSFNVEITTMTAKFSDMNDRNERLDNNIEISDIRYGLSYVNQFKHTCMGELFERLGFK